MSRSQFASAHPQPQPVITVNTGGGSTSVGGTRYFAIQARTRGGWTLPTTLLSATYSAGDSITVAIPASARAAGDDIQRWEILASATNDATQLKSLAWIENYAIDQTTPVSLPASITLSTDAALALGATVANPAALPTGTSRVHGQVREVASLAKFFRYDERSTKTADGATVLTANTGRWEEVANNSTYIASLTGPAGCDRDIRLIPATDVLSPEYAADGSLSLPIRLLWYHDEGVSSDLPQGTRFTLSVLANGANKSELFRNKIKLTFKGFVDLSSGLVDTSDGLGGTMLGVDEEADFTPAKSNLLLQKPLPQGSGYLVEARLKFNLWELNGQIGINTPLALFLFPFAQAGNYSESGVFLGDIVYPTDDRLLVVPGANLQARILSGGAMVASYSFLENPVRLVTGLASNTGSQQITINGDGAAFLRSGTIPISEALRAVVSTQSEQGPVSATSAGVTTTGSTSSLTVTVDYPSDVDGVGTIRSSYPDSQLAGKTAADVVFNPPTIYLFISNGSQIRRFSFNVVADVDQQFAITDWSAGTVVGSVPAPADPYHGPYVPGTPAVVGSGTGGNLAAATYTVQAAFFWDGNQVSRINHGASGTISYWEDDVATLLNSSVPYAALNEPAGFTQPSVGATVTVDVTNGRVLAVGAGVAINDLSSAFHGTYLITAKPTADSVTLRLDNATGGTAPGGTVPASSRLLPAGATGPQGPQGNPGSNGTNGIDGAPGANGIDGFGLFYEYNATTTSGASLGELRLNNSTIASVTAFYVSETDANGVDVGSILGQITTGSILTFRSRDTANEYALFQVSGTPTDNGSDRTIPVTYLAHAGTFSEPENVLLIPTLRGPQGATGADGIDAFGVDFVFDTGTSSGPGDGEMRFNNATPASASLIYLDETTGNLPFLDLITVGSILSFFKSVSIFHAFNVASIVDNGAFRTVGITYLAGTGSFLDGDIIRLVPAFKGATGATGSPGAVSSASGLILTEVASPPATGADEAAIYLSTDGKIYRRAENNGASSELGSGGSSETLVLPSGSSGGLGVLVTATTAPGTLIHTAPSSDFDIITLYASNNHTAAVDVTVQAGSVNRVITVPARNGQNPVYAAIPLNGSVEVRVFASIANVVVIDAFIGRRAAGSGLVVPSGSSNGQAVLIAATSGTGTLIHTAPSSLKHRITFYASNNHTAAVDLTLQIGGTSTQHLRTVTIPAKNGQNPVLANCVLSASTEVRAIAAVTNVVAIDGFIEEFS